MSGLMVLVRRQHGAGFSRYGDNLARHSKLSKPFRRIELLDVVEHVLHRRPRTPA